MKAYLLYPDQDFDLQRALPWHHEALVQDLSLNTLFTAMARGDAFIFEVTKKVTLLGFDNSLGTIRHRQDVLKDCLDQTAVVRRLYALAVEAMEEQKKHWGYGSLNNYPDYVLRYSGELMQAFFGMLKTLRQIADTHADQFASEGWTTFFAMLAHELDDEYLATVQHHLKLLQFRRGTLISAELGKGNKGEHYVLRAPPERSDTWFSRLFTEQPPTYGFTLHPRDETGAKVLGELRDQGIRFVASALGQAAEHVKSFFDMLRRELAFYVGCVNLHEALTQKGQPTQFPTPVATEQSRLSFRGLYDVCLALSMDQHVVGNDADADGKDLVIVTGANTGGKSTFMRSVGLAQLMMQSGIFVPAESFCANVRDGLFTHYKREEDTGMNSGKLDEELSRMSEIVDHLTPHPMVLFNESFSATNEREGSEIARQIMTALLGKEVKIVCVTHLYELAHGFYQRDAPNVMFLRAERQADGIRTFKLFEGIPLRTSFGEDLYLKIFDADPVEVLASDLTAAAGR